MKVAVTGSSGFIGSHLLEHLAGQGHNVVSLARGDLTVPAAANAQAAEGIRPAEELAEYLGDVGAVIHLAARSQQRPDDPLSVYLPPNVHLTETVLRAAGIAGVQRVVFASTRLVYPPNAEVPSEESDEARPTTLYGLSKRIGEQLVDHYRARCGFTATSLRLGQVFGDGDGGRGVLAHFIQQAKAGRDIVVTGRGVAVRDFVHVRDVVRAFVRAVERDASSPVINIGGGGHTIQELADTVAAAAPSGRVTVHNTAVEDEDRSIYRMSCERASQELGWEPRPIAQGVADMMSHTS